MEIRVAARADLDAYVDLLEEAGAWLWERGIRQWEPGSHRAQRRRLARDAARGCVRLAWIDGRLAGGVVLDPDTPALWSDRPEPAAYVYKLAVARAFAGRGVADALLDDCESAASAAGRVRLDCWSGNARLRAYYAERGFCECGDAREHGSVVTRFEKRLRPALESARDRA